MHEDCIAGQRRAATEPVPVALTLARIERRLALLGVHGADDNTGNRHDEKSEI